MVTPLIRYSLPRPDSSQQVASAFGILSFLALTPPWLILAGRLVNRRGRYCSLAAPAEQHCFNAPQKVRLGTINRGSTPTKTRRHLATPWTAEAAILRKKRSLAASAEKNCQNGLPKHHPPRGGSRAQRAGRGRSPTDPTSQIPSANSYFLLPTSHFLLPAPSHGNMFRRRLGRPRRPSYGCRPPQPRRIGWTPSNRIDSVSANPKSYSPFTVHHSPFTIHHSPFTIHHPPFTVPNSSLTYQPIGRRDRRTDGFKTAGTAELL